MLPPADDQPDRALRAEALPPAALATDDGIRLRLTGRAPYDWPALLAYLAARVTAGVDWVDPTTATYWRTVSLGGAVGVLQLGAVGDGRFEVTLSPSLLPVRVPLLARVRRLLDLDAEPDIVYAPLAADPLLGPLVMTRPGLRVPKAFDGVELAMRTVIGQQVSVVGANTLARRLVARHGTPLPASARGQAPAALTHCAVTAAQVARAGVDAIAAIGMPRARAAALVALARAADDGVLPELHDGVARDPQACMRRLRAVPGIGEWTAQYIAMRALAWPDAFPDGDLVLRKAAGGLTAAQLRARAESWRPWRAYAAQQLWTSMATRTGD